tara:strand:- start:11119 stop:12327 length:1209 start_codon:yes stop_codon:yes gene_type:complete
MARPWVVTRDEKGRDARRSRSVAAEARGDRGGERARRTDRAAERDDGAVTDARGMGAKDDDKTRFMAVFRELADGLVRDEIDDRQVKIAVEWIKRMIDYNVPHGKLNRGLAVVDGVRALKAAKNETVGEEELKRAMVVGWCIEFLQAYFLVADDIMDESVTRRGQPCWYRQPDVKMTAINDGILLEMMLYKCLKKYCKGLECYADLVELFHDVTYQTASGQLIDLITAPIGVVDLSKYTMEAYMRIVTYKTAFYTFYLPAACAMRLCGVKDEAAYEKANEICIKLGQFFQIQDDYLDCYGDPEVIGKIGTDIQDNKCGWLVVQALLKCTDEQRKIIEENYGRADAECEKKIKALYVDLDLEATYKKYEEESYADLRSIMESQKVLPEGLFGAMLAKIYKRQK